jgi:mannose-6-phosphate isomerase-like protein (cupin superfamily)
VIVRELGEAELVPAYGILFQQIYPDGGEELADWGVGRAVVEPGGATEAHAHEEHEIFVITAGQGVMTIDDEQRPVRSGQAVLIPVGSRHHLTNASASTRLEFLNVYWPAAMGPIDL